VFQKERKKTGEERKKKERGRGSGMLCFGQRRGKIRRQKRIKKGEERRASVKH
jgi:hypothetical protein